MVNIWKDKWLTSLGDGLLHLIQPVPPYAPTLAWELINTSDGVWNLDSIRLVFLDEEYLAIECTPLGGLVF